MGSEAPMPFHFFVGAAVVGACMGRRVWFDKGYYRIYPNMQILLVGPTGRVRKTSAINLGLAVLRKVGVNIVSEKTTPEALVDALDSEPPLVEGRMLVKRDSHAVLVAPELAVLLGKQKYNEGMIALLTTLFDSPDEWTYKTRGRGEVRLKNVTLTMIGASTPDWLITAIPQDAFGGGFMSRLLFVVQETTDRCYPIPEPPPALDTLVDALRRIQGLGGEMRLTPEALEWYSTWYAATRKAVPEDEKMAGYHERKPDHLLRLAMVLALAEGKTTMDVEHLMRASHALAFLEGEMLYTFKWLGMRPIGQDQERIVRTLRACGGRMEHGELLRKLIYFMNARQFADAIRTLVESRVVREHLSPQSHYYELTEGPQP
jgi:hypothetical protein